MLQHMELPATLWFHCVGLFHCCHQPRHVDHHSLSEKSLLLKGTITCSLALDKSLGDVSSTPLLQNELATCKSVPSAKVVCAVSTVSCYSFIISVDFCIPFSLKQLVFIYDLG